MPARFHGDRSNRWTVKVELTNKLSVSYFIILVWIQVTVKAINLKTLLTSYIKSLFDAANKNSFIYSSREQKDWAVKLKMVSITKNLFRPRSQHIVTTEVLLFRMPFLRFYCITHPRSSEKNRWFFTLEIKGFLIISVICHTNIVALSYKCVNIHYCLP